MATFTRNEDSVYFENLIHWPDRVDHLLTLDEHLSKTARLSRALWNALRNSDLEVRERFAFEELASEIADHASAAELLFHKKQTAE
jgi:hypothetical protein